VRDVLEEDKLRARANAVGERLKARLNARSKRNDAVPIAAIRGLGAMVAFDIVKSRGTHDPDGDVVKRVTAQALANGLVLLSCGIYGETIRILVPLTASDAIIEDGLYRLEKSLVS
jgi:4-aminobutyrate aminotransferase/(S)-3-amino-2-methylpropionate transaminase